MAREKIAITLDKNTVVRLDRLVCQGVYPNRSRAIEDAVKEKLERLNRRHLARECEKLDVNFEEKMAEEGLSGELAEWPEY
jgi:metal-responsive CopG/Arc/MetJ family transcriptional regulator